MEKLVSVDRGAYALKCSPIKLHEKWQEFLVHYRKSAATLASGKDALMSPRIWKVSW